ncbi:MAG: hypothetical protein AAFO85_19270 [Cyanobacteria bacterium J06598_4]
MEDFELPAALDEEYEANVALSYEYIEKSIKEIQDISSQTNTQLGLLIGFNFTFVRFFLTELPDSSVAINSWFCYSCLILKILAYLFSGISIFCCFRGLYRNIDYYIIRPSILIEQCKESSTTELKLGIINTWDKKLQQFIQLTKKKRAFKSLDTFYCSIRLVSYY